MSTEYDEVRGEWSSRLREWVAADLLSADDARRITDWEAARRPPPPKPAAEPAQPPVMSLAAEALAYVGGAVVVAAIAVVMFGYWERIGFPAQVAVSAVATALLFAGGLAVPRRWGAVGVRMRAALWLTASATFLALVAVVVDRAPWGVERSMLLTSAIVLAATAALWFAHRTAPQQVATFLALQFAGIAVTRIAIAHLDNALVGASIAVIAIAWGGCSRTGLLPGGGRWAPPAHGGTPAGSDAAASAQRRWGLGLGTAGAALGGIVLAAGWDTAWMGVIPIVVIVAAGVAIADLLVLIVAAVGTVIVLPMVADRYTQSTIATAIVLLIVGAAMVALAILVARRQTRRHTRSVESEPAAYSR